MSLQKKTTTVITKDNTKTRSKPRRKNKRKKKDSSSFEKELVYAPSAIARTMKTRQPSSFLTPVRKEFVTSVPAYSGNFFNHFRININPGNPTFSQWANNLAKSFESYKFRKLIVHYIARCSTSVSGYIALSPDTNPHDPSPVSEQEMYANENAKSDSPWKNFSVLFTSEMLNKRKTYFCRKDGATPAGADPDLYDIGNFNIATGGQKSADAGFIGQIWVEYQLEFFTPESSQTVLNDTVLGNSTTTISQSNPLGSMTADNIVATSSVLNSIVPDGVGSVLSFAKDFHGMLSMKHVAPSGVTGNPSITSIAGATVNQVEGAWTGNFTGVTAGGTASLLTSLITAKAGDIIRVIGPTFGVTPTNVNLALTPCFL